MIPFAKQTAACITLSLFLSVCSTGCSQLHLLSHAGTEALVINEPSPQQPQNPGIELDFLSKENREGELVFSLAADDFITAYNSLYELDHGKPYLKPLSQWKHSVCENAPHSDYKTDYYIYQSNPALASMPIVSIFIPSDSDCIQEITMGFTESNVSMFYTFYSRTTGTRNWQICSVNYTILHSATTDASLPTDYTPHQELDRRSPLPYCTGGET